ncbi:S-adenosyl-L-methionine-dependent methyltransferase [Violaceomyces palustris]|uniref:S-adenosyl-L-methionine-dependent methyltransferase n=1 Tax=Violaceomyces palustris TaxID=1673888 RepID=A0ACD0P235_9BASI|nr:S-adenosyl-L-methionine-dependent methyltransferase [Violaceomyces palustris]
MKSFFQPLGSQSYGKNASIPSASEFSTLKETILRELDNYEKQLKNQDVEPPFLSESRPHPQLDNPEFLPSHELFQCRRTLLGALGMMSDLVLGPTEKLIKDTLSHHLTTAINIATRLNIADHLEKAGPKGMTSQELREVTGTNSDRITKTLRFLSNNNLFSEVEEGRFANNRFSICLIDGSPLKSWSTWQTSFSLKSAPLVPENWTDEETTDDFDIRAAAPQKAYGIPYNMNIWSFGAKHMFKQFVEFGEAMTAYGSSGIAGLLADFPWNGFQEGTTIVDVGGGKGAMLLPILKNYKHLKGVVQDLESTVPQAKENFETRCPEAIQEGRVEFQAIDFFQPQPRSGEKLVYMLRWVIHDWNDEESVKILTNQANAMSEDSRLLIIDTILQPAIKDKTIPRSGGLAGQTLLLVDFEMMAAINATERTVQQVENLLRRSGLVLEKVYSPGSSFRSPHGVIVARKA